MGSIEDSKPSNQFQTFSQIEELTIIDEGSQTKLVLFPKSYAQKNVVEKMTYGMFYYDLQEHGWSCYLVMYPDKPERLEFKNDNYPDYLFSFKNKPEELIDYIFLATLTIKLDTIYSGKRYIAP